MNHLSTFEAFNLLDPDFDEAQDFENDVLDNIRRCGTICSHPDGWGAHAYAGVVSDKFPAYTLQKGYHQKPVREEPVQQDNHLERLNAQYIYPPSLPSICQTIVDVFEFVWAFTQINGFPHYSPSIAEQVAIEYAQFGEEDAIVRGISPELWIWRRSRFLAGYR